MKNLIEELIGNCNKFYKETIDDEHSRSHSWEYCYKEFNKAHKKESLTEEELDRLCLHLAFYLASWGMYRGSAFLLKRDYKVHKPVVKEILNKKYNNLWAIDVKEYNKVENQKLLAELMNKLKEIYRCIRLSINENIKNDVTDTLVSKVLMGTMGCIPAYDRYFTSAIKDTNVATGNLNVDSIMMLVKFYEEHEAEYENARGKMKIGNLKYPQMKMIDMGFVEYGIAKSESKNKNLLK